MTKPSILLLTLVAACLMQSEQAGAIALYPLLEHECASDSDLVVVGECIGVGQPTKLNAVIPEAAKEWYHPDHKYFREYRFKVIRVIRASPPSASQPQTSASSAPRDTLKVLARSSQRLEQFGYGGCSEAIWPWIRLGRSYVLILYQWPEMQRYYLPARHTIEANPEEIARIESAADPRKWPWGRVVNGLKIALRPSTYWDRKKKAGETFLMVMVRNTSSRELILNTHLPDRVMTIHATGPGGKKIRTDSLSDILRETRELVEEHPRLAEQDGFDLSKWEKEISSRPFFSAAAVRILPGQWRMLDMFSMYLERGKWRIQVTYESSREQENLRLWKGKVESQPVTLEVSGEFGLKSDAAGAAPGESLEALQRASTVGTATK